jgi:carbon storage regulator
MLVLSRKEGQQVVIGDQIHLTVVTIRGNQVRLGFTAPPEVSIQRKELGQTGTRNPSLVGRRKKEAES